MTSPTRRAVLTGLAATAASPALAQFGGGIRSQRDPYAQVNPYDDPRNGFAGDGKRPSEGGAHANPAPTRVVDGRYDIGPLPDEQIEIEAGRAAYGIRLRDGGGAVADQRLQKAIRDFCAPLFAVADRSHLPWVVTLVNTDDINASAGNGGTVIVNRGIIAIYDHPGELAATIAHEIGHVDKRHCFKDSDAYAVVAAMRAAGIDIQGAPMGALIPGAEAIFKDYYDLLLTSYGRELELEADAHEMTIFGRLGIDPIHAINDHKAMLTLEAMSGSGPANPYLRTHPKTSDRLQMIETLAATMPRPKADFQFAGWDILKAAIPTLPAFKKF